MIRQDTPFANFINTEFHKAANAAEVFEVTTATILRQCKKTTQGWKIVARLWGQIKDLRRSNESLRDQYAHLSKQYNELVDKFNGQENGVKEYLNK